ncbi:MAG: MASE3 domain-containing protein [Elusimicrobia bacterium]|nr:MASE3 domain-containing protein [Elusimicrobiota bacterium]
MNKKHLNIFIALSIFLILHFIRTQNYLLFHAVIELSAIIISYGVFAFAWNTRRFNLKNNFYLFIGIAFLYIGVLILFHILSYKGMGVFLGYDSNLPTQLWIVLRFMTGISFFIAPFYAKKKLNVRLVFIIFTIVISLLLASIFYWNVFPVCYIEGEGLTLFKKISEYIICLIFAASILTLLKNRKEFESGVLKILILAIVSSIISELFFTLYSDVYGVYNSLGHYLEFASFYLIYKAILETGFTKPYDTIFKELKESERVLLESDNFNKSLLNTIPFGMDIIDEEGNILFANQNLKKLLGKDIIGKKCWSVYKDDNKQCVHCPLTRGIRISETASIEADCVLGGKTLQITHTGIIYKDKKAILEIFEDITERKQAEQEVKHLASFPKLNPNPVLELDLSGNVVFYNKTCLKILEDLKLQKDVNIFVPRDIQEIIKSLSGKGINSINRDIKVGNKVFKEDIYSVPQFNTIRIYCDDITERKLAEEVLKNENLRLQELDKKKSEFVSIVAHDLRTPLTSIMGFADTIMNKKLNLTGEQKGTYIGYIQEESRRLGRLISNYLDIANIDEGKLELNISETDLKQLIDDTVKMFSTNSKDMRISFESEPDLTGLKADPDRIKQVLQNIIGNAIKYSPQQSIIKITARKKLNDIQVSISDRGPGIPDTEKEKIFHKFYRMDNVLSRDASGTGLGLTITKSIIERHKGKIWIEDNSPIGSIFIFTLPI